MKHFLLIALLFGCGCSTVPIDKKAAIGVDRFPIVYDDTTGLCTIQCEDVSLGDLFWDIARKLKLNGMIEPECESKTVTMDLRGVRPLDVLKLAAEAQGAILDCRHGVYVVRTQTGEEMIAEWARRLYDSLVAEGFSEEQAMQILLKKLR